LPVLSLGLLAASPLTTPTDLVREGNRAYSRGDLATALEHYTLAGERTTDPGMVAFNEAAALYQMGRFREAELSWRRCREDAVGPRRARAVYNLANCLVQQVKGNEAGRLREAISLYRGCLQEADSDAELADDARHNLELARALWLRARTAKDGRPDSNDEQGSDQPPPDDPKQPDQPGSEEAAAAQPARNGKPERGSEQPGDASAQPDQQPPPGKGNVPPLPDEDDLVRLSEEDAAEHLRQAAARIRRESREHRQQPRPAAAARVKDW
jgi:tetratricopeptide (TPR) repeat protein